MFHSLSLLLFIFFFCSSESISNVFSPRWLILLHSQKSSLLNYFQLLYLLTLELFFLMVFICWTSHFVHVLFSDFIQLSICVLLELPELPKTIISNSLLASTDRKPCIDLLFLRVSYQCFSPFLWWCHISLIFCDSCNLVLMCIWSSHIFQLLQTGFSRESPSPVSSQRFWRGQQADCFQNPWTGELIHWVTNKPAAWVYRG